MQKFEQFCHSKKNVVFRIFILFNLQGLKDFHVDGMQHYSYSH